MRAQTSSLDGTGAFAPSGAATVHAAFARPVADAQQCFRAALAALSEPGIPALLAQAPLHAPEGLSPCLYALCLSLCDMETALWLSPRFSHPEIRVNLSFHCGCRFASAREEADFALMAAEELEDISGFSIGSERYPDRSCTILCAIPSLFGGPRMSWHGPGIENRRDAQLPIPEIFWRQRAEKNDFPRGIDVFFAAEDECALVGLPRTTRANHRIEEAR
ncbi:MAG: phosphonate C-P lyase system protein PhnH [Zoogloeaceae bacterium]|jgi:alpha-D-ribose 1-methylphosphonate 5-triphosphate synthase subunit PhnH|nr:phosphonate C-P lyase system protein PhnH [Zoogloeaceae bacterium]